MQINCITLNNFKQYKSERIDFPTGLTGFIGKNGAGKSTLFEAISNALYGKLEGNKDKVRNDKALEKEPIIIEMVFEDKGNIYTVTREYKGKNLTPKAELKKDLNTLATGATEVSKQITKIIKIDYNNFKNSFFAHQKEVTSLLNLGIQDRQTALRKMLGLEKMDKFEKKTKDEIKEQTAEIRGKESELLTSSQEEQLNESIAKINEEIKNTTDDYRKQKKVFDDEQGKYNEIKSELAKLTKTKKENDKLNGQLEIAKTNLINTENNLQTANKELATLNEEVSEYKKLIPQKEKYEQLTEEIQKLQEIEKKFINKKNFEKNLMDSNEKLSKENDKIESKRKQLIDYSDIEENVKKIEDLISSKEKSLKQLQKSSKRVVEKVGFINQTIDQIETHKKEIEELGRESLCPTCERPLEKHYDILINKYKQEILKLQENREEENKNNEELDNKIKKLTEEIKKEEKQLSKENERKVKKESLEEITCDIEKNISDLNDQITEIKKEINKIGKVEFNEDDLKSAKAAQENIKDDYEKCISLSKKQNEIPGKKKEINDLQEIIKGVTITIKELKDNIIELGFNENEYDKTHTARETKEVELDKLKNELSEVEKVLSGLEFELKSAKNDLNTNKMRKEKIETLKKDVDLLERLKNLTAAFKEKITSQELPNISKGASDLFSKITKGRYHDLKIDSDFNFKINRDGNEVDLNTLSGGEKDLASLCLRISISERVSKLAGRSNMGFLALDEVFGSLDEERREELLAALHLISEKFKQIFIVSHNQDVQQEFPNKLIITKLGDFSKAELYQN